MWSLWEKRKNPTICFQSEKQEDKDRIQQWETWGEKIGSPGITAAILAHIDNVSIYSKDLKQLSQYAEILS